MEALVSNLQPNFLPPSLFRYPSVAPPSVKPWKSGWTRRERRSSKTIDGGYRGEKWRPAVACLPGNCLDSPRVTSRPVNTAPFHDFPLFSRRQKTERGVRVVENRKSDIGWNREHNVFITTVFDHRKI